MKLSEQVADLERKNEALEALLGEIMATIEINIELGTLTTADNPYFERIRQSWRRRRMEIEVSGAQYLICIGIKNDGRCNCAQGDPCPLGRAGMAPRCSREELIAAGVRTFSVFTSRAR